MFEPPTGGIDDAPAGLRVGRVSDLPKFISWLAATGMMKSGTAQSYQTAATQILAALDARGLNVLALDVDRWCRTFADRRSDLAPQTVDTYQTRFRKAVDLYRQWLEDPEHLRAPATREPLMLLGEPGAGKSALIARVARNSASRATTDEGLVSYPFPLGDGRLATLALPHPLSRSDAERLSQFVLSLATPQIADVGMLGSDSGLNPEERWPVQEPSTQEP